MSHVLIGVTREVLLPVRARGTRPAALRHEPSEEVATPASVDWHWFDILSDSNTVLV